MSHDPIIAKLAAVICLALVGCGASRKPVETRMVRVNGGQVAMPVVGAPPVWEQGRWTCVNNRYRYNHLTTRCELE